MTNINETEKPVLYTKSEQYPEYEYALIPGEVNYPGLREQLIDCYETPWCDPVYLRIFNPPLNDLNVCKLFVRSNETSHILLFRCNSQTRYLRIINHCYAITDSEIKLIHSIIFQTFPRVKSIVFPFIFIDASVKHPLTAVMKRQADMVLELPATIDEYMMQLGTKTRQKVRNCQKRIAADFPEFKIQHFVGQEIQHEQLCSLVELSKMRGQLTEQQREKDRQESENLYQYVRTNGHMSLLTIGSKIIGGSLNFTFNGVAYGDILTHDYKYNRYDVGKITAVNTIKYMIETNRKRFHLLWGKEDYKRSFGAKPQYLYDLAIFRRPLECFACRIIYGFWTLIRHYRNALAKDKRIKTLYRKIRRLIAR